MQNSSDKNQAMEKFIERLTMIEEKTPPFCVVCYLNLKTINALLFGEDLDQVSGYEIVKSIIMYSRMIHISAEKREKGKVLHFIFNNTKLCQANVNEAYEIIMDKLVKVGEVSTKDGEEYSGVYQ